MLGLPDEISFDDTFPVAIVLELVLFEVVASESLEPQLEPQEENKNSAEYANNKTGKLLDLIVTASTSDLLLLLATRYQ